MLWHTLLGTSAHTFLTILSSGKNVTTRSDRMSEAEVSFPNPHKIKITGHA